MYACSQMYMCTLCSLTNSCFHRTYNKMLNVYICTANFSVFFYDLISLFNEQERAKDHLILRRLHKLFKRFNIGLQ